MKVKTFRYGGFSFTAEVDEAVNEFLKDITKKFYKYSIDINGDYLRVFYEKMDMDEV